MNLTGLDKRHIIVSPQQVKYQVSLMAKGLVESAYRDFLL